MQADLGDLVVLVVGVVVDVAVAVDHRGDVAGRVVGIPGRRPGRVGAGGALRLRRPAAGRAGRPGHAGDLAVIVVGPRRGPRGVVAGQVALDLRQEVPVAVVRVRVLQRVHHTGYPAGDGRIGRRQRLVRGVPRVRGGQPRWEGVAVG